MECCRCRNAEYRELRFCSAWRRSRKRGESRNVCKFECRFKITAAAVAFAFGSSSCADVLNQGLHGQCAGSAASLRSSNGKARLACHLQAPRVQHKQSRRAPLASSRFASKNELMSAASVAQIHSPVLHRASSSTQAPRPNPSFKATPNSVACLAASAGPSAHFAPAARHATLPGSP